VTAIRWPCKHCGAEVGSRCTNYVVKICAAYTGRKPPPRKPKPHAWGATAPPSVQRGLFDEYECDAATLDGRQA